MAEPLISGRLAARAKATQSLFELYQKAQECAELHEAAGLPVPGEVQGMLTGGEEIEKPRKSGTAAVGLRSLAVLPTLYPTIPEDLASIPLQEAQPATLIAALIQQAQPVPRADLVRLAQERGIVLTDAAVWRVVPRLVDAGIIEMDALKRYSSTGNSVAAAIDEETNRLFGPPEVFQAVELATHRREAIVAFLRQYQPMLKSELVDLVERTPWLHASAHPSLIKGDLEMLRVAGIARRRENRTEPNLWAWELVEPKAQPERALKLA